MAVPIQQTRLRIVGGSSLPRASVLVHAEADILPAAHERDAEAAAVAQANVLRANLDAARLSALDARWILAVQVDRALTGGKAAMLAPDARDRLLALGERVGLRPFDVSLVIAIVQDAARAGEDPLGRFAEDRLRLVRPAEADAPFGQPAPWPMWGQAWVWVLATVLTLALAAGAAWLMTRWIVG